jgi:hypothetical protein
VLFTIRRIVDIRSKREDGKTSYMEEEVKVDIYIYYKRDKKNLKLFLNNFLYTIIYNALILDFSRKAICKR